MAVRETIKIPRQNVNMNKESNPKDSALQASLEKHQDSLKALSLMAPITGIVCEKWILSSLLLIYKLSNKFTTINLPFGQTTVKIILFY